MEMLNHKKQISFNNYKIKDSLITKLSWWILTRNDHLLLNLEPGTGILLMVILQFWKHLITSGNFNQKKYGLVKICFYRHQLLILAHICHICIFHLTLGCNLRTSLILSQTILTAAMLKITADSPHPVIKFLKQKCHLILL